MKTLAVLILACAVLLLAKPISALDYEREIALELSYGSALDQVGVWTPTLDARDVIPIGPRNFRVVGDTLIYIGDAVNGKIKRFRVGDGLDLVTEGGVDCDNGFAVARDGRIFVEGPLGMRDITVFDDRGKYQLKTPNAIYRVAEKEPEWTIGRLEQTMLEAQEAGLQRRVLQDSLGRTYEFRRVDGDPKSARFFVISDKGEDLEFEIWLKDAHIPEEFGSVDKILYWSVDDGGKLYAVCASRKPEPEVILSWDDREDLVSYWDIVVLVYDTSRALLGGVRFGGSPPQMVSYYDTAKVTPNGNIYCYNYTAEGLQVVRYRPVEED
jgi:hypothetical protein